jgi:acyl carrier protein
MAKKVLTTEEGVREYLIEELAQLLSCDETEITPGSTIKDDLGGDSLDCVEIVMMIEETYGVSISDEEAEKAITFDQLVALTLSKLQ